MKIKSVHLAVEYEQKKTKEKTGFHESILLTRSSILCLKLSNASCEVMISVPDVKKSEGYTLHLIRIF